ncbi:TetR/AcrR family transcriptional regulator [Clostridium sp. DL1XJH146]
MAKGDIGKAQQKKNIKRTNLLEAAYELFTTKGINETAIDDIVKKAGVAKGTFYLYYKNKYDIVDRIVLNKSSAVLKHAMDKVNHEAMDKEKLDSEQLILFLDNIIDYLDQNKTVLKLIHKNLTWGFFEKVLHDQYRESAKEIHEMFDLFITYLKEKGKDEKEAIKIFFTALELTSSISYSSIINKEPYDINEMKPILYKTVRLMIEN